MCVHTHAHYFRYFSLRKVTFSRDWNDVRELAMQISEKTTSAKALR